MLTTPVLRCLKQQTGAEVHYLTKSFFGQLLTANPYVDRVFTIQKNLSEVLPKLREEQYDFIVDLHHNLRTWRLKRALGVPARAFCKNQFPKMVDR